THRPLEAVVTGAVVEGGGLRDRGEARYLRRQDASRARGVEKHGGTHAPAGDVVLGVDAGEEATPHDPAGIWVDGRRDLAPLRGDRDSRGTQLADAFGGRAGPVPVAEREAISVARAFADAMPLRVQRHERGDGQRT